MKSLHFLWIAISLGAAAPLTPTLCGANTPGNCDCGITEPGFDAYSWVLPDGCRVCFLQYVPPSASKPMKVHLAIGDSILSTTDGTQSWKIAADAYGFAVIQVKKETLWNFGNDGVVNFTHPMPCSNLDSRDIPFLSGIFDHVKGANATFVQGKATVSGFSVHSMFAAYVALCFHEEVLGVAQGGSGLVVRGSFPPRLETACSQSSFATHGEDCAVKDPCSFCEVWPVYPCHTPTPMVDCLFTYESDFLAGTDDNMYVALAAEGHDARMLKFGGSRGHSWPLNHKDWIAGCLGLGAGGPCSATCTNSFVVCILGGSSFSSCMRRKDSLSRCAPGCSPSYGMMLKSETPYLFQRTVEGAWGETEQQKSTRSSSSRCSAQASAVARSSSGTSPVATCSQGMQENFKCGTQRMIDTRRSATGGVCRPASDGSSSRCCGDGVCDGPETACYCPDDCTGSLCSLLGFNSSFEDRRLSTDSHMHSMCAPGQSSLCCGDGLCNGPETWHECPQDCSQGQLSSTASFRVSTRTSAADATAFLKNFACSETRRQQCCGDGKCDGPETVALCPLDCNGKVDGRGGYCDGAQGFTDGKGISLPGVWTIPMETSTTTTTVTSTKSENATVIVTSTSIPAYTCSCITGSLLAALYVSQLRFHR